MKKLSDTFDDAEIEAISDYQYQMIMRPASTETCIMILFAPGMVCHHPLEAADKLGNKEFSVPVNFIYGENDWVPLYEEQAPQRVVEANLDQQHSKVYELPGAGHNFHFDNPQGLLSLIFNIFLDESNEVKKAAEYEHDGFLN